MNVLIGRCKEMPRKRDPEGKPQKFKMLPSQQMQQEAYSHASPPKGTFCNHLLIEYMYLFNKCGILSKYIEFSITCSLLFICTIVMSTQVLRNMIRQSDLDGLEKVVLDGHGGKIIGENASDSKIRTFIRAVPSYMVITFL